MRHSLIFFALSSVLDEFSTFIHLSLGGMEFNPRVAWLLGINPMLYTLADIVLLLGFWVIDGRLGNRRELWLVWASAGIARLICASWSLV
ncbi:MAG: hypothetical protein NWE89_06165 [Candidatus Bathyarchaeota archaeon]|nr:hypothetical protein [Candidatus Bathyarchaeota archaeon]